MINRIIITGFVALCLVFTLYLFPTEGITVSKDSVPKAAATTPVVKPPAPVKAATPATTPSAPTELNAAIEKIFIKNNRVFVILNRTGSGKIAPEDYAKIIMRIETSKGPRQWSLAEVDKTRSLGTGTGRVEFDTGIILDKSEAVKGLLLFGKIEKPKQEMLVLAPAIAGGKTAPTTPGMTTMKAEGKQPTQSPTRMNSVMAGAVSRRNTTRTPIPLELDDSGGIRIATPGEGQIQKPGDVLLVQSMFLRTLTDPTAVNNVEFTLRKLGVPDVFATVQQPYRQSSDDMNCSTRINIPISGLPLGPHFYIAANHPEAWGIGNTFTIRTPGEGQIRVLRPRRNEGVTPGFAMNIDYQFTRHVGDGRMSFELYKLDGEGRYGSPVMTFTRNYRSGRADLPEPILQTSYTLPRDLAIGRYFLQITHPEAWGKSDNFEVAWEREGRSFPSDYSVVDIYKQGNDVKARVRATGGDIADTLDVRVNGVDRREIIRPATDTIIQVQELPSGATCGAFYEVAIDPGDRLDETTRTNNNLSKWVPFQGNDGYAVPHGDGTSGSTREYVPCEPPRGFTSYGFTSVIVHNCSAESMGFDAETRQIGWITHTNQLNIVVPHQIYVAPTCSEYEFGLRTRGTSIPPGGCGMIRVGIDDLRRLDSVLNFQFIGDMTRWRTLTNPVMIDLKFGRTQHIYNFDTGRTDIRCEFND